MVGELIRDVEVRGSEGYLSFLDGFVDDLSRDEGIDEDTVSNIVIAMSEAMNNAYLHGNGGVDSLPIVIKVYRDGGGFSFSVLDCGKGFDFGQLREDLNDDILDVPGGRGIFIMRALADEVVFNDAGNQVTLKFHCS